MKYFVVVKTVKAVEVEAENPTAAEELVYNQLKQQNPQQLIEVSVAEEVEFKPVEQEEIKSEQVEE